MNEYDQSAVAYEDGPKEVNDKRRMPSSEKQFGKESKTMPQDGKVHKKQQPKVHKVSRHSEYR